MIKDFHIGNKMEAFDDFIHRKASGVTTGLLPLDTLTGGLRGLSLIQGEPGCNKSTLASQILLHHIQRGGFGAMIDCENGLNRLRARLISQLSGKAMTKVMQGACKEYYQKLQDLDLYIFNEIAIEKFSSLVEAVFDVTDKHVLFVVDSVQSLPYSDDNVRKSIDKWTALFNQLKLTYENKITFLCISEKNRSSYGMASKSGGKESGSLEYKAEIVLDMYVKPDSVDDVYCQIVKDRDGVSGATLRFEKQYEDRKDRRSFNFTLGLPDQALEF